MQLGSPVSDIANLSGTASQPGSPVVNGPQGAPASGTITFSLYGPNDATCATTPVFTSPPINVSGNGLYSSGNFTPTAVGTYRWIASYTGNSPNTLGTTGLCNASNESVVVMRRRRFDGADLHGEGLRHDHGRCRGRQPRG